MPVYTNLVIGCICILLLIIAWQDFKTRTVYVFLFALLFISALFLQYLRCGFSEEAYVHIALNTSVVCMQLLVLYGYLKIVRKINFFDGMGLGDVFFYICIIPMLSVPVFIFFNISSLVFALLIYTLAGKKIHMESGAIPLAGIQAVTLLLTIIIVEGFFSIPVLGTCFLLSI